MAIIDRDPPLPLPPTVRSRIDVLRQSIRRYVWLEGLAALAVGLGFWFWASMAIDWTLEPPLLVREIVLAAGGLVLVAIAHRYVLRRAFVRLSDSQMATVLERRFPEFHDSLLTTVVLAGRPPERTGFSRQMLADTSRRAEQQMAAAAVREVFDPMPLVRKLVIALGLAGVVSVLAWLAPDVLKLWAERNLLLAEKQWPRKIRLEVVGFNNGVAKVAAGSNFDLRVRAYRGDTEIPVLPDVVEIRYRYDVGGDDRKPLKRIGAAASLASPRDQVLQEYGYQFTGLNSSVQFDIVGGDARVRDYIIKVVPNPALALSLRCQYPDYMERGPSTIEVGTDAVAVPMGAKLIVSGTASKPLETVRIDLPGTERNSASYLELSGLQLGDERRVFSYPCDPFPNPRSVKKKLADEKTAAEGKAASQSPQEYTLLFTLRDADGIKGREPIALNLVAVPDDPPEVKVRLIGTREPVVTTRGRLPATGKITDDHGLGRAWWDFAVQQPAKPPAAGDKPSDPPQAAPPRTGEIDFGQLSGHPVEYAVNEREAVLEAAQLKVAEGEKLTLTMRAADLCNLGAGPNVGSGETWQLEVVTEAQLLTRLEARELLLRQRFEQIVQEMTETRNLLLKMDFSPPGKVDSAPKAREIGGEPGEAPSAPQNLSADDLKARRQERTLQALQNCRKNGLETAEVAAGVDEIRLQLTNNRVESEERKTRLDLNVSRPLHIIVEEMFPVFEKRLEALQPVVGDLVAGPAQRDQAREQADAILAQMEEVLKHMIVMEDFNRAVVERLQRLIEQQKALNQATKKKDAESLGEKE